VSAPVLPASDPEAIERARNRVLRSVWEGLETLDARADRLSMHATLFDRPEGAWSEPARYGAAAAGDLARFAGDFLAAERAVELTVLPRESDA